MKRQLHAQAIIITVAVIVYLGGVVGPPLLAKVKVRAEWDKAFDFKAARSWAWNPTDAGQVFAARTPDDDPVALRKVAEPLIKDAVATEIPKTGLQSASGQPDLIVTYYLLLSINTSSQTMGQFLPSTVQWGLPPFAPATSAMTVMNRGSLVLDFSAKDTVVWRGVAQADLKTDTDDKKRVEAIREAVQELLKKYPSKR